MAAATSGKDDKMVSNKKDAAKKSGKGLNWFGRLVRAAGSNFIGFYFDTGLTYRG